MRSRNIATKLKTVAPPESLFREVFEKVAAKHDLTLTDQIYSQVIREIRSHGTPLAYFQPKFIVEQVLVSCKYEGMVPQFTAENVEDAMLNLFIEEDEVEIDDQGETAGTVSQIKVAAVG